MVSIKRAESAGDIAAIQAFRFRIWSEQEGVRLNDMESGLIADLHDGHAYHWGAYDGGVLVGSARLCIHNDLESAPDGEMFTGLPIPVPAASLNRLVIDRAHRGHGLAARLDAARLSVARTMGAKVVIITPMARAGRIQYLSNLGFLAVPRYGAPIWSSEVSITVMYLIL